VLARKTLHAAEQIGGQRPGSALGLSGRVRGAQLREAGSSSGSGDGRSMSAQ